MSSLTLAINLAVALIALNGFRAKLSKGRDKTGMGRRYDDMMRCIIAYCVLTVTLLVPTIWYMFDAIEALLVASIALTLAAIACQTISTIKAYQLERHKTKRRAR